MYTLFNSGKLSDKNVFKYTNAAFMENRIFEYLGRYHQLRSSGISGRINSNHLLITILMSMDVEFDGNLIEFLSKCDKKANSLSRTLGMTSSFGTGKLFHGTLYPGCDEIVIQNRNSNHMWFDLWNNWRTVSAISVLVHPVTDLTVFELGVVDSPVLSNPGLCVYSVDMAVMYTQWQFYRASKSNPNMEAFLSEIVIPNAFNSHIDIVPFNRILARRGLIPYCTVKSNLPFNQQSINQELDRILTQVEKNITGRRLRFNQYLSAIPTITGEDFFNEVYSPDLMPTSQAMWAIIASKLKQAMFVLDVGAEIEYAGMSDLIVKLKRTVIEVEQQNLFGTGLTGDSSKLLRRLFNEQVVERIPY